MTISKIVLAALCAVCFSVAGLAQPVDVPHMISYQGLLTDASGNPVPDGSHSVIITLYSDAGGSNVIWTSTFQVPTSHGVFNVILGDSGKALPTPFMIPLWLGVAVDGGAEMRPLTEVVSAPYALGIADSTVSTTKIQDGAVTAAKMGQPFVGAVTLSNGNFSTAKGKNIDFTVGTNLNLQVLIDSTTGNIRAIIDALGGGTMTGVRAGEGINVDNTNPTDPIISIAQQGVTTDLIRDYAVDSTKLATGSVNSRTILDGSILGIDIAANTITGTNIATHTITGLNIAIPLILSSNIPGEVLDVQNTADNVGGVSIVNINGNSSDGTPNVAITGTVTGGPSLTVSNNGGTAIYGSSSASGTNAVEGVVSDASANNAAGVSGFANMGSSYTQWGVEGASNANGSGSAGVVGTYNGSTGTNAGVWGAGNNAWGVYGSSTARSGVYGTTSASGPTSAGVRGVSTAAANGVGVEADAGGTGVNVGASAVPATGVNVTASSTGVNVNNGAGTGIAVGTTTTGGITVAATAGATNVSISGAATQGVLVSGASPTGVRVTTTGATGVSVSGQTTTGVAVASPATGTGVAVTGGTTGVSVMNATTGASVQGGTTGIMVGTSSVPSANAIVAVNNAAGNATVDASNNAPGGSLMTGAAGAAVRATVGNISIPASNTNGAVIVSSEANNQFGTTSMDETKMTINGIVTARPILNNNQYELWINGDANITGTLKVHDLDVTNFNVIGGICVAGLNSPAVGGKSFAPYGVGLVGISHPQGSYSPGNGVIGVVVDPGYNSGVESSLACGTAAVNPEIISGVYGLTHNPQYYGGAFMTLNDVALATGPTSTTGIYATGMIAHSYDNSTSWGRGILVEQNGANSQNVMHTGIEIRNQPPTPSPTSVATGEIKTGMWINSHGGLIDTGIVIDPVIYGIDVQAGTAVTNDYGLRIRPTIGQTQEDGIIVDGSNMNQAGAQSTTRGITINSDASNNMQYGVRIGTIAGNSGGQVTSANAPQNGVDVTFVGNNAGFGNPNFGFRAFTTAGTPNNGAGVVVGNGTTQNPNEGAVIQASSVGVRIGTYFQNAFNSASGVTPATGESITIANGGTGATTTTQNGNGQITKGYEATNSGSGNIITGINVQETGAGSITTGTNVQATSGSITTGGNITTTSGTITTGYNVSTTAGGGLTTGFNALTASSNLITGVNVNAGLNLTTGANYTASGTIGTGVTVNNTTGTIGTGFNASNTSGGFTNAGLNISTTTGAIPTGVNVTTQTGGITTGANITTTGASNIGTGVNVQTTGGAAITTGMNVQTTTAGITTGVTVNNTSGGITTGFNANASSGPITTGVNVNAGTNLTTGASYNAGTFITTGVGITAGTTVGTGVNITGASGVTTGVNVANVANGGNGFVANPLNAANATGVRVGATTRFATGVTAFANAAPAGVLSYNANPFGGVLANNTPGALTNSVGIQGTLLTPNSTFAAMTAISPGSALTDFSAAIAGDASNATQGNNRPGVIGVTNSPIVAGQPNQGVNRGAIEAYNIGGGIAFGGYSTGIPFYGVTTGMYPMSTGVEGIANVATNGVGMIGSSTSTNAGYRVGTMGILSSNMPVNDALQANDAAGVLGTTGSGSTAFVGVLGTDVNTTSPAFSAGIHAGVYGVTGSTGGFNAGVIGEAPAIGAAFLTNGASNGNGVYANSVTTGTAFNAGGITSGTGLNVNALTSGTGVNLGTSITSGNGIAGTLPGAATGHLENYTNNSATSAINLINSSTGQGVVIANNSTGIGEQVFNNSTTGDGIQVQNSTANGNGIHILNGSTGTGEGLFVEQSNGTSATDLAELKLNGAGPVTNALKITGGFTNAINIDPAVTGINSTTTTNGAVFTVTGAATTNGITINASGAGTNTGLTVNATGGTNTGIVVNTGVNPDLTINEDQILRNAEIDINTTSNANTVGIRQGRLTLGLDNANGSQVVFNDQTAGNTWTGTLTTVDPLTANRTWALPDISGTIGVFPPGVGGFVYYDTPIQQNSANTAANWLYNVSTNAAFAATSKGALINSATTAGSATGLTVTSTAAGAASTSTSISANASGGTTSNYGANLVASTAGAGTAVALVASSSSTGGGATDGADISANGGVGSTSSLTGLSVASNGSAATASSRGVVILATAGNVAGSSEGLDITADGSTAAGLGNLGIGMQVLSAAGINEGISMLVNGAATNIGEDLSVGGAAGIGIRIGNGSSVGTGVRVNNPTTGVDVTNLASVPSSNGVQVTFAAGAGGGNGFKVDMNNASGAAVGVAISNQNVGTGVSIGENGAVGITGITINNSGAGTGINLSNVTSGTGISMAGAISGTGFSISGALSGTGINVGNFATGTGIWVAGGTTGTGVRIDAAGTKALNITGGSVMSSAAVAAPSNRWADSFTPGAVAGPVTITNNLVTATSTVILSLESPLGNFETIEVVAGSIIAGQFKVQTSAAAFAATDVIHYMVINH